MGESSVGNTGALDNERKKRKKHMIYVGIDIASEKHDYFMIHLLTNMARKAAKVHSAKNVNLDAQTICTYMIDHSDSFSPYTLSLYHNEALKSLSRKRFFIVEDLRKAKLVVNSLIQVIFPEFKFTSSDFRNLWNS